MAKRSDRPGRLGFEDRSERRDFSIDQAEHQEAGDQENNSDCEQCESGMSPGYIRVQPKSVGEDCCENKYQTIYQR